MLEYPHKFRLALRFGGDGDESALCASASPSDSDKLLLYALAKQAECGSCNTPRPSFWDASIDKAKWDAWAEVGHRSKVFSNRDPFSPYVTPHSPHVSALN